MSKRKVILMSNVLIEREIDYEEMLKQYDWLCNLTSHEGLQGLVLGQADALNAREGLLSMLQEMIADLFTTTHIYATDGETHDEYMVIFPDESVYLMSHDADMPNGVCGYYSQEPDVLWTQLDNGDMVPVG